MSLAEVFDGCRAWNVSLSKRHKCLDWGRAQSVRTGLAYKRVGLHTLLVPKYNI